MKRNTFFFIIVVAILLLVGWFFFRFINSDELLRDEDSGFRTWFWDKRGLDLTVQVILVFAGALGIAAILPDEEENG